MGRASATIDGLSWLKNIEEKLSVNQVCRGLGGAKRSGETCWAAPISIAGRDPTLCHRRWHARPHDRKDLERWGTNLDMRDGAKRSTSRR